MQDDIILGGGKRNKFSWKIFGIVMAALAVVGIIFGAVSLAAKNSEVAEVKAKCAAEGAGAEEESVTCADLGEVATTNPIFKAEAPEAYILNEHSSSFDMNGKMAFLGVKAKNGTVVGCEMEVRNENGYDEGDCQISGVAGEIYKIVEINDTSIEGFRNGLGFIMTDGRVEYLPLDGNDSNNFTVMGTLKIDGFVIDVVNAEVQPNEYVTGSEWSTLFVLRSGKILKLDAAMLEDM